MQETLTKKARALALHHVWGDVATVARGADETEINSTTDDGGCSNNQTATLHVA